MTHRSTEVDQIYFLSRYVFTHVLSEARGSRLKKKTKRTDMRPVEAVTSTWRKPALAREAQEKAMKMNSAKCSLAKYSPGFV